MDTYFRKRMTVVVISAAMKTKTPNTPREMTQAMCIFGWAAGLALFIR